MTVAAFVAAPIVARLVERIPPRFTVGGSLALAAIGMWLASRLDGDSRWTALLAGFIVAGVGLGAASASTSQAALSAVDHSRAGMATGTVNTMRQIGTAAGVAVLGALYQHRVSDAMAQRLAGTPLPATQAHALAAAVGDGAGTRIVTAVPDTARASIAAAARSATAAGLHEILLDGAVLAGLAAIIALVVVSRSTPAPATAPAVSTRDTPMLAAQH